MTVDEGHAATVNQGQPRAGRGEATNQGASLLPKHDSAPVLRLKAEVPATALPTSCMSPGCADTATGVGCAIPMAQTNCWETLS